jgi:hypothetical protein
MIVLTPFISLTPLLPPKKLTARAEPDSVVALVTKKRQPTLATRENLMNARLIIVEVAVATAFAFGFGAGEAPAETETIPSTFLPAGTHRSFGFYAEEIHDDGTKILSFSGKATNDSDNASKSSRLDIFFDYLDAMGNEIFVGEGQNINVVPGNTTDYPISATVTLSFCPRSVSLHFVPKDYSVTVSGTFTHTCVPAPEPTSFCSLASGVAAAAAVARPRRKR